MTPQDDSGTALDAAQELPAAVEWRPPTFSIHSTIKPVERSTVLPSIGSGRLPSTGPNFFRNARWSPDGNCILATLDDHSVQLIHRSEDGKLNPAAPIKQSAPLVETVWYPGATTYYPETFCYLTSVRDHPAKLVDGISGKLRASYTIFDHRERFVAPHGMAFDRTATRLYCGYENAIEVFDFQSARAVQRLRIKKQAGLKGIVSSLAFASSGDGTYAAGTLGGAVGLFSDQTGAELLGTLSGASSGNGVTQVQWHPTRPYEIYVGYRRADAVYGWDIRYRKTVLGAWGRKGSNTNQRMRFDVDPGGKWLATGDEDGCIAFFDVQEEMCEDAGSGEMTEPVSRIDVSTRNEGGQGQRQGVGSVAFSPVRGEVMWVTGSRTLPSDDDEDDDSESEIDGRMGLWALDG